MFIHSSTSWYNSILLNIRQQGLLKAFKNNDICPHSWYIRPINVFRHEDYILCCASCICCCCCCCCCYCSCSVPSLLSISLVLAIVHFKWLCCVHNIRMIIGVVTAVVILVAIRDARFDAIRSTSCLRNGLLIYEISSSRSRRQKLHVSYSPKCHTPLTVFIGQSELW